MGRELRYKEIQLSQLRSFCLAATERNFTAAARALGVSAPTVWQQVRALERRLQTTLMRRSGRSVELTPEGQLLLDLVHPHVSGLDSLEPLFLARQLQLPRAVTVAVIPYLSSHLLQPVRTFSAAHPTTRLKLHVCVWFEEVLRMVEQGQADLGVMFYDRDGPRNLRLEYERLFDLRFALMTPPDHPLVSKKRVGPRDLVSYPLIAPPEGSFARRTLEQLLQRHNLAGQVHIVMETVLLDVIRKYVAAGVGIALVHVGGEVDPWHDVHVRVFEARRESVSAAAVVRKGTHLSEAAQEFQQLVRQFLSEKPGERGV